MPSATARKGPRPRHIPQRTCVACGSVTAKRGLVRIVRGPEGSVRPDPTGKAPGRGAYLHSDRECWERALRKKNLEHSLKVSLQPADVEALQSFAATLPQGEVVA